MSGNNAVRSMVRSPFVVVVGVILTWFIAAFLVWPNVNILIATFFPDGSFSGRAAEKLFSSQRAMKALGNSFLLAVALSVTVNLVGVFIVLVTHYFRIRGSRILFLGYASTFIYGGIVLAAGYKFIYGDKGIVTSLLVRVVPGMDPGWFSGFFAVLAVMTFATTTNHMLFVANALNGIDYQTIEAARNLGASTWTILRRIVLPMLKPTLFAVTILSFLTGLGALSAPQVLGGRDFQTITPMILTFTNSPTSRDLAALLAVILGLATMVMLAVMSRLEKGGTYFSVSKVSSELQKQDIANPVANVAVHAVAYLLFAVYTLPVVLIVLYSFADGAAIQTGQLSFSNLTLDNYIRVLTQQSGLRPFIVSVVYSALAAVIAVGGLLFVARLLQKYKNWVASTFEYLLHIPWILPSALLALGLIVSYDHSNPLVGGAVLTGTTVILLIAFVTVKIPFTLRMLKASFAAVNSSLEEAAAIMGAKTLYVFRRILLPLVLPAAAAITALNFNSLLDDYDTAIFLAHPLVQPLGLVIKANTDGAEGTEGIANTFVYTVLLMVITGVTMYLVYGRSGRRKGRKRLPAAPAGPQVSGAGLPGAQAPGEDDATRPAAAVR
ncbi:iron ABC transporter permease [Pseudarthrobacter sp902506025]|uniref:Iron(III) transport system permease protein n=1 Tax=Pseudarthrobacter defluvii TaxID=410837 RepID=A0ABT9UIA5_9MICC|nr:iron ABC transporter permease [Pseudarthrobacter defluvii]MDQ0119374.1 iron(III) transport system permease protein [Pseudarthrobacter defluvii]